MKIIGKFEQFERGGVSGRKGLGNWSLTASFCCSRMGRPSEPSVLSRRSPRFARSVRCGRAVTLIDRYRVTNEIRSPSLPRLRPFLLERALWKGRTRDKKDETWAGSDVVRVSRDAPRRERRMRREREREREIKRKETENSQRYEGQWEEKRGRAAREIYRMTTMTMTRCGATQRGRRFHFLYATATREM